jgi:hypothetical protein
MLIVVNEYLRYVNIRGNAGFFEATEQSQQADRRKTG